MSEPQTVEWSNDKQRWLFERGAAPTLLAGGINSGKSVGCVLKLLALLHKYPNSRAAIVRRSKSQLQKTTMETWYQWCHPRMYSKGHRTEDKLTLNNGSVVFFIHLDQPNSLDLLAGLELNFVYVSQAEEIAEKAWDLLDVRVGRWTGATIPEEDFDAFGGRENWPWRSPKGVCVPPRYIFAESYVTDESHFLYLRFAEDSPQRERWAKLGYESKIVWSEENQYAIRATVEASLAKDEDYVRRYVRPEWGNPEGKIFRISEASKLEYNPALIERILYRMKLHRAFDHGDSAPACCLWCATDHDGNIFIYREYYMPDKLVSEHRQAIFDLSKYDGLDGMYAPRYHSNLADPTIFEKSRGRTANSKPSWSIADEYSDTRIMPVETALRWSPSENGEDVTRSRMKEYLKIDPTHRNPITGVMGAPHLYFIKKHKGDWPNGCDMVIREINAQQREKATVGDREVWLDARDETIVDHAYDAAKYFVISRPSLGPMLPAEPLQPGEIPVSAYEAAEVNSRYRKRREERSAGLSSLGWGN